MSRESLGSTGFESTNVEELLKEIKSESVSSADQTAFKGTTIGQEALLEKKLGLDAASAPKTDVKKIRKSSAETIQETKTEENEFTTLFNTVKNYKEGEIISGIVSKINNGIVYVDMDYKAEGIIEPEEISSKEFVKANDVCKPGDKIWVKILRLENKAGNPVLSKKRADYDLAWNKLNHAVKTNEDLEVHVTGQRDGGLMVDFEGVSAYIPNNHLTKEDNQKIETLTGSTISVKVIKVHRARRKVILSHRGSKDKNSQEIQEALKNIHPGDVIKGKVSSIKSFGAFVNLGKVDGLVHISEISWKRVEKVEDVLEVDQEVEVYVLGIDEANNRISLSMKKLEKDPWAEVEKTLHAGDTVQCTITRLAQFGAFALITEGVEGLIHITELSDNKQIKYPQEAVEVGKQYTAKILRLDTKSKRIALSLRSDAAISADVQQQPSTESIASS